VNRYSRFQGFKKDLSVLREKHVVVVGVGGLGVIVLDTLARLGVGTLEFFDLDTLETANLNRGVFLPEQIGMKKVDAIKEHLQKVNADVCSIARFGDVTDDAFKTFKESLAKCHVLMGCVDTPHARVFLNREAVKTNTPYIDGGAREDGMDGAVLTIIPKKTPCYRCNKPVFEPVSAPKREGPSGMCYATSLPTTMGIVGSLQSQEAIKCLLGLGDPAPALIYRGIEGTVERLDIGRDPACKVCGGVGQ